MILSEKMVFCCGCLQVAAREGNAKKGQQWLEDAWFLSPPTAKSQNTLTSNLGQSIQSWKHNVPSYCVVVGILGVACLYFCSNQVLICPKPYAGGKVGGGND